MRLSVHKDEKGKSSVRISYIGENQAQVSEFWSLSTKKQKQTFHQQFVRPHLADRHRPFEPASPAKVVDHQHRFRPPQFVIARKSGRFWKMRDKIFADELTN